MKYMFNSERFDAALRDRGLETLRVTRKDGKVCQNTFE